MSLTKLQKDSVKKLIKEHTGIDIIKITQWGAMFEQLFPNEENYSLYYKGSEKGARLHLKIYIDSSNFNITQFVGSSDFLTDFHQIVQQGIQKELTSIMNLVCSKTFNVEQCFESITLAAGHIDSISDSICFDFLSRISYTYKPFNPYIPEMIYITEKADCIIIRCANEGRRSVEDAENIKISDRALMAFHKREDGLRYILLKMIEYVHYQSTYRMFFESTPFEYFENIQNLDELISAYQKERLVYAMLDI